MQTKQHVSRQKQFHTTTSVTGDMFVTQEKALWVTRCCDRAEGEAEMQDSLWANIQKHTSGLRAGVVVKRFRPRTVCVSLHGG